MDVLIKAVPQMKAFADVRGVQVLSVGSQDMNDERGSNSRPKSIVSRSVGCRWCGDHARHRHDGGDSVFPEPGREDRQAGSPHGIDAAIDVVQRRRAAEHLQRGRRRLGSEGQGTWRAGRRQRRHSGARAITNATATDVQTFTSTEAGLIGVCLFDDRTFVRSPARAHTTATPFTVKEGQPLPRVDAIYAHAGMSPDLIDSAVASGAKGIVIAGVGDGNMTTPALDAVKRAIAKGTVVVRASRVGEGSVRRNIEVEDDKIGTVASMESSIRPRRACC